MAQILGVQMLCVGFLLLTGAGRGCEGGSASRSARSSSAAAEAEAALLSDSESYHDKCEGFECPECPDDSSMSEASDSRESFYADDVQMHSLLQPQPFSDADRERAKRDLQTDLQAECCGTCHCNKCPEQPQCPAGEVLIELQTASGQPGDCCTQFKCGPEPQCAAGDTNVSYWLDSCSKCNSCQQPPCQDVCYQADPPHNCISSDKKLMFNGQTWLEGCIECRCIAGDKQCIAPKDCQLYDGEVPEADKSTTLTSSSTTTSPTTEPAVVVQLPTQASIEISMEEVEPKPDSVESVAVPEIVATEQEQQSKESGLQKQSVEAELKPTVKAELKKQQPEEAEPMPKSVEAELMPNSVDSELKPESVELELLAAQTTQSSHSTSDDLPETTMESDTTEELLLASTELPLSEEKLEVVTMDGVSTDSTADLPSSTSSTLQTDDNLEQSTAADLDNLQTSEATASSAPFYMPFSSSPYSVSTQTSHSASTLTTESPAASPTASPAQLTPESTSFHRDKDIRDTDYRLASGSVHETSKHETYLQNIWKSTPVIVGASVIGIVVLIVVPLAVIACCKRRKSMYSSVPNSDSNLSANTHASELVLDIEPHYDDNNLLQKQQLKKSVE
ncbi:hypothetical protein KR093_008246 [Drosophila rubida]|uniref:Uncharacterized protein n=1 Tax=Drosophila rubida TaxID=30044 RepID=A0AAD4K0Z4_9MUSC|nr:hypothetical protein KR093_008246 [Drosophila rubida]